MASVKKLHLLLKIIKVKLANAAKVVTEYMNLKKSEQNKLNSLIGFEAEYAEKFRKNKVPLSAVRVNYYRDFMSNLEQSIERQHLKIKQIEQTAEAKKKIWYQIHNQYNLLNKHITKLEKGIEQEKIYKLQKELDNMVNDKFGRDN